MNKNNTISNINGIDDVFFIIGFVNSSIFEGSIDADVFAGCFGLGFGCCCFVVMNAD